MHHSNDKISRVQCNVKNCIYNVKGQFCKADNIQIKFHNGTTNAITQKGTDCATFTLEEGLR